MEADSKYSESFSKRRDEGVKLDSGSFGDLWRCKDNVTGEIIAFKEIKFKSVDHFKGKGVPHIIVREASLLKRLQHKNIVRMFDVVCTDESVALVLEYVSTNLQAYLWDKGERHILGSRTVKSFLHQILKGVAYCHSMTIFHRDLRPDNVLIDEEKQLVKIADFGLAKLIGVPMEEYTSGPEFKPYLAPEILHDNHKYSFPIDVWAVGCMFAEMVTGDILFPDLQNGLYQLDSIFSLLGTPHNKEDWPKWKKFCQDKNFALDRNPKDLSQKFARLDEAGIDLLSKMLCVDPIQRITAAEALRHDYFRDVDN